MSNRYKMQATKLAFQNKP